MSPTNILPILPPVVNDDATAVANEDTSDGYHSFKDLYEHRSLLYIALMQSHPEISWWSRLHEDGTMFEGGWIIAGMDFGPEGSITYHLEAKYIPYLRGVQELPFGRHWDGHTCDDVLLRLRTYSLRLADGRA